jgi:hypothetical protein
MLLRYFFGEDVFISYTRADAITYAAGLANEFDAPRFLLFSGPVGHAPGRELPKPLRSVLGRSMAFLLVGSDGATRSAAANLEDEPRARDPAAARAAKVGIGAFRRSEASAKGRWHWQRFQDCPGRRNTTTNFSLLRSEGASATYLWISRRRSDSLAAWPCNGCITTMAPSRMYGGTGL